MPEEIKPTPTEVIEQPAATIVDTTAFSKEASFPDDGDSRKSLPKDLDKTIVNFDDFKKIVDAKDPNHEPPKVDDKSKLPEGDKNPEVKVTAGEKEVDKVEPKTEVLVDSPPIQPPVDPKKLQEEETTKNGEAAVKMLSRMSKEGKEFLKARMDDLHSSREQVKELTGKVDKR